jgi:hypothetical protein
MEHTLTKVCSASRSTNLGNYLAGGRSAEITSTVFSVYFFARQIWQTYIVDLQQLVYYCCATIVYRLIGMVLSSGSRARLLLLVSVDFYFVVLGYGMDTVTGS